MNALPHLSNLVAQTLSDAELLACDAVTEGAGLLLQQSAALLAAASAGDLVETEARLWTCRRVLTTAITSWREAVPQSDREDAR